LLYSKEIHKEEHEKLWPGPSKVGKSVEKGQVSPSNGGITDVGEEGSLCKRTYPQRLVNAIGIESKSRAKRTCETNWMVPDKEVASVIPRTIK